MTKLVPSFVTSANSFYVKSVDVISAYVAIWPQIQNKITSLWNSYNKKLTYLCFNTSSINPKLNDNPNHSPNPPVSLSH